MNPAARDKLFPYIVPASWVRHVGASALVSWEIASDVFIVLVFDDAGSVRNVRPEDLSALELDEDSAYELAAHNLGKAWQSGQFELASATLLDGTQLGCARGNWMAPAGALVLGNFHAALSEQFGTSEFAAVAVNQECLFAFPLDERTLASASLRLALDDEFRGHRKPISRQWLYLNGEWPQQYSGEQLF